MPAATVKPTPYFSVIIPVHNDWGPLADCLESMGKQSGTPEFEVIVVDDGSRDEGPKSIHQYGTFFPVRVVRQPHSGIAAARNRGAQESRGAILLFTDADCRLERTCLSALREKITSSPDHSYFQLRLAGDFSNLLARAEDLRLATIQDLHLQPDGRIRYLNTSGFALRKSAIGAQTELFDPAARRSEDTLLLTDLIQRGELPLFVADALVRHIIQMSFTECIRKDIRVAWLEARTFDLIAAKGVRVRMKNRERVAMLRSTWKASSQASLGKSAWFVLAFRQALQRAISVLYRSLPSRSRVNSAADLR